MDTDEVAGQADELARERFGSYDGRGAYMALVRAGVEGLVVGQAAKQQFGVSRRTLSDRCAEAGLPSPGAIMAWGKVLACRMRYVGTTEINEAALGVFSSGSAWSGAMARLTGYRPSERPSLGEMFDAWADSEGWTGEGSIEAVVVPLRRNGRQPRDSGGDPRSPEAMANRMELSDVEWAACQEAAEWVATFVRERLDAEHAGTWTDPTADTVIGRLELPLRRHCQLLQVALEIAVREHGTSIADLQNKYMEEKSA